MNATRFTLLSAAVLAACLAHLAPLRAADEDRLPNTLTDRERQEGWRLLFDGRTMNGWHAYRGNKDIPSVWKVVDGAVVCSPKNGRRPGDIVTDDRFGNFQLHFEWKVSIGANSGVMYKVSESEEEPWMTGPEYQILDNKKHGDGRNPKTSAASVYALYAPNGDFTKPVGEWNASSIIVDGGHAEHWLNGHKVLAYELGSSDWSQRVAASKFKGLPKFGKEHRGHIDLQFHGDEVWYRNIRIKPLADSR
jgi:hypothetical protein